MMAPWATPVTHSSDLDVLKIIFLNRNLRTRITFCVSLGPQNTWYRALHIVVIDQNAFGMQLYLIVFHWCLIC